jgi:hypothetical protein
VVHTLVHPRLLERDQILRLLDDQHRRSLARWAPADRARIRVGQVEADRAVPHALLHIADRIGQRNGRLLLALQDVERNPLGRAPTDPGKPPELSNQTVNGLRVGQRRADMAGRAWRGS